MKETNLPADMCPCCGARVDKNRLAIDVPGQIVVLGGVAKRFPGRMLEMLQLLNEAYPRPVSNDEMIRKIYGLNEEPEDANGSLSVTISHSKPDLRKLGIEIISTHTDHGYRGRRLRFMNREPEFTKKLVQPITTYGGRPIGSGFKEIPDNPPLNGLNSHGHYGYNKGCRCGVCVGAHRDYQRKYQRDYYYRRTRNTDGNVPTDNLLKRADEQVQ